MQGLRPHVGIGFLSVRCVTCIRFFSSRGRFYRDSYEYTQLLQDCNSEKDLKIIHAQIISSGFQQNQFLAAKLVSSYAEYGSSGMEDAWQVFDGVLERDVLLWNVVIRGYANSSRFVEAIKVYRCMQESGVSPNMYTFPFLLKACAPIGGKRMGREIHGHVLTSGLACDLFVANALIALYAKYGDIWIARKLFEEIREKDLVSWNSMISGYRQNGCAQDALLLFRQMVGGETMQSPDRVTLVIVLPVCAELATIQDGMWIHSYIIKMGIEIDVALGSCLVGMYAKCGRLGPARALFDRMPERNVVAWNVMIGGYGMHGHAGKALEMFFEMVESGVQADESSIVSVLSACSHSGMVDKGLEVFERMGEFGVEPSSVHYACVVDLLGRAGKLDKAVTLIKGMPVQAGKDVWGALLGACRIHNNIELAEEAAEKLFVLEPENAGRYVLLAKMYEEVGQWGDTARLRKLMKERGVRKPLGCSAIEVDRTVHTFGVEDEMHPMSGSIYDTLEGLERVMEMIG